MALLNTAYALAGLGRHVLILDMDLEAPGVSGFLKRHHQLGKAPKYDIVDLLTHIRDYTRNGGRPEHAVKAIGSLSRYLTRVKPSKLKDLAPPIGEPGRLDILAAKGDEEVSREKGRTVLGKTKKRSWIRFWRRRAKPSMAP